MEVRGSVLRSIEEFVSEKHSDNYDKWRASLSKNTRDYLRNVGAQKWYPLEDGVIDPTQKMCDLCYDNTKEGSWESGRFSAEMGLTGIYKVFVLVSSPSFLMKRSSRVLKTFYSSTDIEIKDSGNDFILVHILQLPENNEILEHRIGGWMEKALELCGCEGLNITISEALSKGDSRTVYMIKWK